jgi:transcription elongation factor GreA
VTGPTSTTNEAPRLSQVIGTYLSTLPQEQRESTARELSRFSRWIGPDTPVDQITPVEVDRYQEQFSETTVDINSRLEPLKSFLTSLKTRKLTATNLGAQIRLKRPPARKRSAEAIARDEPEEIRVTEEGFAKLSAELEHLERVVRPEVTGDLQRAAADKDFRENAPYDAAKQKLSQVQGRINDIRRTLGAASIYTAQNSDVVDLGMTVTLHSLDDNEDVVYTIVGAGEVSARDGKISLQSPIGRALTDRRAGDIVHVETPAGVHNFRIERIERRA